METKVSLNVLSRIRNWQVLYGLKRGNFRSYRRFCIRKSRKIRQKNKMHFNTGKNFSKLKFEKLLLERDPLDAQVMIQFNKRKNQIVEEISEAQANKLALDIGRILLLMIGKYLCCA